MQEFSFDAIGTSWTITLPEHLSVADVERIRQTLLDRIDEFDRTYSRFREDSLVTRMAKETGTYVLPEDAQPMFDVYRDLYRITGGAFTPLIGQTLADAGYDAAYSFRPSDPMKPPSWDEALSYAYPDLTTNMPVLLDVGAAGKGYLVDLLAGLIRTEGVDTFVIDAGGDIRAEGPEVQVALEHPENPLEAIGVAAIANASICGSSGSRRAWGDYHHILDPHTLASPRGILASWVVASSTMIADALATCLFLVEPETLSAYDFDYLVVLPDHSVRSSSGFPAALFLS